MCYVPLPLYYKGLLFSIFFRSQKGINCLHGHWQSLMDDWSGTIFLGALLGLGFRIDVHRCWSHLQFWAGFSFFCILSAIKQADASQSCTLSECSLFFVHAQLLFAQSSKLNWITHQGWQCGYWTCCMDLFNRLDGESQGSRVAIFLVGLFSLID